MGTVSDSTRSIGKEVIDAVNRAEAERDAKFNRRMIIAVIIFSIMSVVVGFIIAFGSKYPLR